MALTRKFLSALGIEADKVDEIITAHTDTVDALKEQRDQYKAEAEKLPKVQGELDELKKASEGQDGTNPFEVKYNELVKEYEKYKLDVEAKQLKATKESAYRKLLVDAGVSEKRVDSILKITNLDEIQVDENGKVIDEAKALDSIKTEWSDFIVTTQKQGVNTATPPNNNGQKSTMTKADILAIKDGAERRKAIAENPTLFGLE